jgi:hypothetical protein
MTDDKQKRGPADRSRIDVNETYELEYWTKSLGVSPQQLKDSVKRVGPMADDVRRDLGK